MYFDYSSPPPHNSSQALPTTLHPPNSLSTSFLWLTKFNLYYPCAHGCRGIHWSVFRPPGATYWKRTDSPLFGHLESVTSSPVRGLELVSSSQPPPLPSGMLKVWYILHVLCKQPLRLHGCRGPVTSRRNRLILVLPDLWLLHPFRATVAHSGPWALGVGEMK